MKKEYVMPCVQYVMFSHTIMAASVLESTEGTSIDSDDAVSSNTVVESGECLAKESSIPLW